LLSVYRSNRAELLARLLAARLLLTPPHPFEQVQVVVNTWPTSRWLGEQLAIHLGGIAANLRFPFPDSRLRQLVAPTQEEDPWRASHLVWPVLELLPSIAARSEGEPLRTWLGGRDLDRRLDLACWQLGRAIADAFDDYGLYRPDLLQAWEEGAGSEERTRALPESQRWQPLLYQALRRRLASEPFGLRVLRLIERLRQGTPPTGLEVSPLRLFGVSRLAPVQVQLLQALSATMPVEIYLLTPCRDLWQRCTDRRRELSDALALQRPLDADWLRAAPGLEARFGRMGAEFQQLLEGTGDAQLGTSQDSDLFFAPATVEQRHRPGRTASLLAQLQETLADPQRQTTLELGPGDHSLEFHPCPGRLRQVQIVRDRVLQLMAADPSLEPRDILVMTPRVDDFAPLVASVFGDADATGVELPWRLTDRSQQSQAGIARTLLELLRLAGERFTASGLETLLECPPLQERFGLDPGQSGRLNGVLQQCGFRWGLDGHERGGDPTHSLSWAIDRLLLGLVLPATAGLAPGDTAPFAGGGSLELSGRWLHLLTRLRSWLMELRQGCTCPQWGRRLRALLEDLFGDGGEAGWELPPLLAAIEDWQQATGDCALLLEAPVVAAVLEERLAIDSGRFGHRSGALTISALEPMRAIPHRVVVLMGLDAGVFPRQRQRPAFHLMERQRRLGDPHPADQDRYVLMEALLSARDHLLLCWTCRDDRSGRELPPASPVRQWLQWLEAELGEAAARLMVNHAASPLERSNFLPLGERPPPSCDRRLLATRLLLDGGDPPDEAGGLLQGAMPAALPLPPGTEADPFEQLRGWVMAPQRQWLRQLGLRAGEWEETVEDLEALELDERERASLLRRVQDESASGHQGPTIAGEWIDHLRGQGRLPAGAAGELESRRLERRRSSLHRVLEELGAPRQEPIAWGPYQAAPLRRGDAVVVVHLGRPRTPQRMDLWLQLLLAAAAGIRGEGSLSSGMPRQGVLIAREKDRFEVTFRLEAPDAEAARRELERLAAVREDWRGTCWPVPPRTGWAWLEAEAKQAGKGPGKATETWEGGFDHPGERQTPEIALCFGADLPAATLLDERFAALAATLYGPVLEASR
jgi:exodeoxyribonuclease V gamma subunit